MFPYLSKAYSIFLLTRPANALQPIILAVVGCIVAGQAFDSLQMYALLMVILLIHGAVTMWNDIQDVAIDRRNKIETILTAGYISTRTLQWVVVGQLTAALSLFYFLPPFTWALLVLLAMIGWQYSSQPSMLSRRPIGSMVALAISYGFLPLLLGASLGGVTVATVILAILWSLSRVSLSVLKDYKDAVGDAEHNKRTFLLVFGHRKVRTYSVALAVIGNAGVIYYTSQYIPGHTLGLFYLLTSGLFAAGILWRLRLYGKASYTDLHDVFHQSLYIQLFFEGVIVLCLMLS